MPIVYWRELPFPTPIQTVRQRLLPAPPITAGTSAGREFPARLPHYREAPRFGTMRATSPLNNTLSTGCAVFLFGAVCGLQTSSSAQPGGDWNSSPRAGRETSQNAPSLADESHLPRDSVFQISVQRLFRKLPLCQSHAQFGQTARVNLIAGVMPEVTTSM
jgi:hypothetical protein